MGWFYRCATERLLLDGMPRWCLQGNLSRGACTGWRANAGLGCNARVWQHFRGSFLMVAESLLRSDIVGKA